jgi:hypothetical protein
MEATRSIIRILTLLVALGVLVGAGLWYYQHSAREREIRRLEQEKRQLEQIIDRITTERRLAEVLVTDTKVVSGVRETRLLFVEYARDQKTALVPREFTIRGEMAHVDAMVVKFERGLVFAGDKLKGSSIALFTKIYGDKEAPEQGAVIDSPGSVPAVYAGADPAAAEFEKTLWTNFWRLAEEEAFRVQHGVRLAHGQGVWWPPKPGFLYTLTIEADGGINLATEPIRGIYSEALRAKAQTQPAAKEPR